MATPYAEPATAIDQSRNPAVDPLNYRSVTPAMNNTRGGVRTASPNPVRGPSPGRMAYNRSVTPNRYDSFQNPPEPSGVVQQLGAPSQSGLIRLTLRKPMGIVFEPMYDPNAPLVQRGVRICDLPRTGAAALSRRLEVGDELLSINDKTMSRLTFDEIMDFIIEADPEEVNLLFRRPNKETLKERAGIKTPTTNPTGPGVKWVDDESPKKKKEKSSSKKKDKEKKSSAKSRSKSDPEDDETLQSEDVGYRNRRRKGRRKDPYETESFLDILIDTICANPDSVCRDRRRGDYEDYSDDDETFASRDDDSTYVTYESEDHRKSRKQKAKTKGQNRDDDSYSEGETEEDTLDEKRNGRDKDAKRSSPPPKEMNKRSSPPPKTKKYEDDNTLETMDTAERAKHIQALQVQDPDAIVPPLGLAPNPEPNPAVHNIPTEDDEGNPAPVKEVEYDDQVDHSADVSVMESLGGPSLLIEKQRAQQMAAQKPTPTPPVPAEIMENFGKDYPLDFGFSREQTIQNDPLRFYTFVVKSLLQEHEPEKVRLLDKLLAKYKGREDHLVQKLSVRYNKEDGEESFEDAVRKEKDSAHVRSNVETAKERIQSDFPTEWPDKESKEGDADDDQDEAGSEYSGDSIDGTSPAVIAQVSELLNYVYGKTSVPGQIDRVSTIMRAYEGREAVLLELLETKALIKANREKENAGALPAFLRNSNAQRNMDIEASNNGDMPPVTPMAATAPISDDISSMSGVSTPAAEAQQISAGVLKQITVSHRNDICHRRRTLQLTH